MGFMPSRIWTQQPQQALEVDRSHRFAQGLIWASIADGPNLLAPTAYPTFAGSYRREVGVAGRCVKAPSAQSAGTATWSASLSIPEGSDYAIAIFAKPSTDAGGVVTHAFPGTNLNELALSASGFTATIDNNTSNTASYAGTKPELFMASRIGNQAYVYVPNGTTSNRITGTRAQSITSVVAGRTTGNNFVNTETYLILVFTRSFSVSEYRYFAQNPWQIFKPIPRDIFASVGSSGDAFASGSVPSVSTSSVSGTASSSSLASSSVSSVSLYAVTGSASGTSASNGNAAGSVVAISLSSPSASANGSAQASSSVAYVSLSSVSGSAFATSGSTGSGDVDSIAISAATAIAVASSVASGGVQSIGITAPSGTASSASANGSASGYFDAISLFAPSGVGVNETYVRAPYGAGPSVISPSSRRVSNISEQARPANVTGKRG